MEQLTALRSWLLDHDKRAHENMRAPNAFVALFDGPSVADKERTIDRISKEFNKEVSRNQLSKIVSKFIDETEQNLEAVFRKADSKNWILVFDEADALFGKRSEVKDAHDRYANIEVNYLLQKIEEFRGLVIFMAKTKANIDEPFIRRFNAIIHFASPHKG